MKKIPGPQGFSFLKILPSLISNPLKCLTDQSRKHGGFFLYSLSKFRMYYVNDPDVVKHILITNHTNYDRRTAIKGVIPLLGNGLFSSDEVYWELQQKMIQPSFHIKTYDRLVPIIIESFDSMKTKWQGFVKNSTIFDLQNEMKLLLLEILIKNFYSEETPYPANEILNALDDLIEDTGIKKHLLREGGFYLAKKIGFKYKPDRSKTTNALKVVDDFIYTLIDNCKSGKIKPSGLLAALLEEEKEGRISRLQIRDDLATFLFAGFDTTAEGLTFMLNAVCKNKRILDNLMIEYKNLLNEKNAAVISPADIINMKYCTYTAYETLRLFPPAWAFYRVSNEEDSINGYKIPPKSYFMFSPFTLHRNPELWQNPDEFLPERFEGDTITPTSGFKFIPFGAGRHICIGRRMAQFEMNILSALILTNFVLEPQNSKEPDLQPAIILKTKYPLLFKVSNYV